MTILDFLVIGLYALGMLAVGRYYASRTQSSDDYLLGGRRMSPLLIGLSLFATLFSTLSYLAYPGEMIKNGPMIFAQLVAYPVALVLVGWLLIPSIMQQKVTSGYELLESRLGLSGRLLGSGMFVALRTVWMASILYATSDKVLRPLLGLSEAWTPWISAVMAIITLIYTAEGGLRAVVMTDALQSLIMFAGAILTVAVITHLTGGVGGWWPKQWVSTWQEPVFWFNTSARVTFMGAFLNMVVWMTCTAGSDQMAIQRYLATRDAAAARRSFAINLLVGVLSTASLALVGLAVLGYFTAHPSELPPGQSVTEAADILLPRFIVYGLPPGVTGLVIAALLSAAMSSLSSGVNSSSAVITKDFISRFRKVPLSETEMIRLARFISVLVGIVAFAVSIGVPYLAENLLDLCIKVVNLLTAPLFVLFFLALYVPWATPLGGIVGTLSSIAVAVAIAFFKLFGLEMLWTAPLSLVAGVAIGVVISLVPISRRAMISPEVLSATDTTTG